MCPLKPVKGSNVVGQDKDISGWPPTPSPTNPLPGAVSQPAFAGLREVPRPEGAGEIHPLNGKGKFEDLPHLAGAEWEATAGRKCEPFRLGHADAGSQPRISVRLASFASHDLAVSHRRLERAIVAFGLVCIR